jgi:cell division protein FtsW
VVIVATAVAMVWVAGLQNRYLAAGAALFLILGIFAVRVELYRFARVVGFFGPHSVAVKVIDPTGSLLAELAADERYRNELGLGHLRTGAGEAGAEAATPEEGKKARNYQLEQGRIALGSGGIMGLGLGGSIQKLFYLPEAHTDFIWAVVGEELGFLGTAGTWVVFGLILWRGLRLSFTVTDPFGRYLALGVTVLLVGQAFFNMSVVLGLLPTKGIPLPMVSYGGSSLLSSMLSMGLLLSVNDHAT